MMNPSPTRDSPRGRRWLWAALGMFFVGVACIVFLPAENPNAIAVNSTPIREIHTNDEHWVIFRFDAPKSRAVMIQQVLAVGGDRILSLAGTRVESFPDPNRSVHERINAGGSKLLKVRRVGGGDWQARFDFFVPLKFGGQWRARIKDSWRQKSFKPWSRNYIERGQRFVESEFVKTTETVVAPTPFPAPLWQAEIFPSAFLPFDEGGDAGESRSRGALIHPIQKEQMR